MRKGILVAQVTDCHLPSDLQQQYRGIDPHKNLQTLIKKIRKMKPDLLLATGDLSEDGGRPSYLALQKYFKPLRVPVLALPGNHDDPALLADIFPGSPVDSIAVSEHGPWHIIRLNSCLPGRPEGRLSEKARSGLEHFLNHHQHAPLLIAGHHQPVNIGSPWIDKYPLTEAEGFLRLVDKHANVKAVIWGHVHQVFEVDRMGTAMLAGPSSAINALPGAQKFTPDETGPACRWLELRVDQTLLSGIIR